MTTEELNWLYPEESRPPRLPFDPIKFSQLHSEAVTLLARGKRPREAYEKVTEFIRTHEPPEEKAAR